MSIPVPSEDVRALDAIASAFDCEWWNDPFDALSTIGQILESTGRSVNWKQ